ncbi:MAG: hypothetical protein ACFFCS_21090 [Candidatus Hodarchaeota archaeon]
MSMKIPETLYMEIVQQFDDDDVDYERIGKVIVSVCREIHTNGDKLKFDTVAQNALLLILGLIHKDEPIEEFGNDLWELDPSEIAKRLVEFKEVFNQE